MKSNISKLILSIFAVVFVAVGFGVSSQVAKADDVSDTQKTIKKTQAELDKEQAELERSQANLSVTQSQINTTASQISKTETEISRKEKELENLKKKIELNKKILTAYTQEMYFSDQEVTSVLASFSDQNFGDYFRSFDQALNAKGKVLAIMKEIKEDKEKIEEVKEELAEKKEEHEKLLVQKQAEKNVIVSDINETKLTISQLQAKMAKLRSRLSSFLGKSFSMDDVIDAVKLAEKKTGVRKEFLFAVLDKESDLGRFTGGCTYKNTRIRDENPDDESAFKQICKDLGYDYKKMKVSCALSYGYGGAMGVAQFMPTTWNGYKDDISKKTGNKPADPWNLKDGIMGMALYLKNKGGDSKGGEYQAAAMYYCGGNWKRTVCYNYADTVISWSKGYDDYF